MPKAAKETKSKPRAKTFEDVFVTKPEHEHCKQVLASKRIRDVCFTAWDTSREPYFPEDNRGERVLTFRRGRACFA